jgi:catechol 2,3-dioxygenase
MTYLVNSIGYISFNVRNLAAMVADSTDILGLHVTETSSSSTMLSSNGRRAEMVLHPSQENSCRCVGLEAVTREAVREVAKRAKEAGCRIVRQKPALPFVEDGVAFATDDGHILEVHTPIPTPLYGRRHLTKGVGPNRIDHVNISTEDPVRLQKLLTHVLGVKLSERIGEDDVSFMRGANRQHHMFSIVRGSSSLHHYAWEFREFGDYLRLGDNLDLHQRNFVWGPGRHRAGDNVYAYYIDAMGAMVECSHDMAYIADDAVFSPPTLDPGPPPGDPIVLNCWGTRPPTEWLEQRHPFTKVEALSAVN